MEQFHLDVECGLSPHTLEAYDYEPARFLKWCAELQGTAVGATASMGDG